LTSDKDLCEPYHFTTNVFNTTICNAFRYFLPHPFLLNSHTHPLWLSLLAP